MEIRWSHWLLAVVLASLLHWQFLRHSTIGDMASAQAGQQVSTLRINLGDKPSVAVSNTASAEVLQSRVVDQSPRPIKPQTTSERKPQSKALNAAKPKPASKIRARKSIEKTPKQAKVKVSEADPKRIQAKVVAKKVEQPEPVVERKPDEQTIQRGGPLSASSAADSARLASVPAKTGDRGQTTVSSKAEPDPALTTAYSARLSSYLGRHKRYPKRAKRKNQQGVVELEFNVDRNGLVTEFRILRSSGYRLLDEEVEKMLQRASPLPRIPRGIDEQVMTFSIPVAFQLD